MLHQASNYIKLHRLIYKRQSISYGILYTGLWELDRHVGEVLVSLLTH